MIRKRKNSKGQPYYQVIIRDNDGHPPKYETFPTMQEAKDWEVKEKARRRTEVYFPERINKKQIVGELIDKYIAGSQIISMRPPFRKNESLCFEALSRYRNLSIA